jgi:hypothetical protein
MYTHAIGVPSLPIATRIDNCSIYHKTKPANLPLLPARLFNAIKVFLSTFELSCSSPQKLAWRHVLRTLALPLRKDTLRRCSSLQGSSHQLASQLKRIHALRTVSGEGILRLCLLPSLRLRTRTLMLISSTSRTCAHSLLYLLP